MTMDEIEKWLVLFFARYHLEDHGGIGMPPLVKWRQGYGNQRQTRSRVASPTH